MKFVGVLFSCDQQSRMKTLQGLAMGIQCFGGELPFFFISGWLLKKIGHINAMTLVLFTFGIRLFLYSLLSNPWLVLPIELMQGVTFGVFYSTMATYASIVAPPGTAATLQVILAKLFSEHSSSSCERSDAQLIILKLCGVSSNKTDFKKFRRFLPHFVPTLKPHCFHPGAGRCYFRRCWRINR